MKFIQLITDDAPACSGGACAVPAGEPAAPPASPADDQESALVGAEAEVVVEKHL